MATKVERWQSDDGQLHLTEIDAKRHDFGKPCFLCPCCKGKGTVDGKPIMESRYDRELTAHSGSMYPLNSMQQVGFHQDCCRVCDGEGFTRKEKKPITKEVITGYE